VCACVCVRERERESSSITWHHMCERRNSIERNIVEKTSTRPFLVETGVTARSLIYIRGSTSFHLSLSLYTSSSTSFRLSLFLYIYKGCSTSFHLSLSLHLYQHLFPSLSLSLHTSFHLSLCLYTSATYYSDNIQLKMKKKNPDRARQPSSTPCGIIRLA